MSKSFSLKILPFVLVMLLGITAAVLAPKQTNAPVNTTDNHAPPAPVLTSIFFAGDIMLSRNVSAKALESDDITLPFAKVAEQIQKADIAFANLESPFSDKGARVTQGIVFKAPPELVAGLVASGFDILSTANNHSFDQGKYGIEYTLKLLADKDIAAVGTGTDCHDGAIIEKNNIKFGFLAYSYAAYNDGGKLPDPLVCDWNDKAQIARDIQNLKLKSDYLIISTHMGTEYMRRPEEPNVELSHAAVDAGADLVIGHHPHWIQVPEKYNGKWIFYSLGNFVFDQMWSQDTKEGLTLLATLEGKELKRIELKPVVIEGYCCPRWANEQESKAILKKVGLTSPLLLDKN